MPGRRHPVLTRSRYLALYVIISRCRMKFGTGRHIEARPNAGERERENGAANGGETRRERDAGRVVAGEGWKRGWIVDSTVGSGWFDFADLWPPREFRANFVLGFAAPRTYNAVQKFRSSRWGNLPRCAVAARRECRIFRRKTIEWNALGIVKLQVRRVGLVACYKFEIAVCLVFFFF